ncbi:MAG: hypothetical protein QOJ63_3240 [Solirubrobacteraceae bacterium]|jgi:hypothetical protein|nr:hypothetical protein [Solirubrobacteraceae bacterium]
MTASRHGQAPASRARNRLYGAVGTALTTVLRDAFEDGPADPATRIAVIDVHALCEDLLVQFAATCDRPGEALTARDSIRLEPSRLLAPLSAELGPVSARLLAAPHAWPDLIACSAVAALSRCRAASVVACRITGTAGAGYDVLAMSVGARVPDPAQRHDRGVQPLVDAIAAAAARVRPHGTVPTGKPHRVAVAGIGAEGAAPACG